MLLSMEYYGSMTDWKQNLNPFTKKKENRQCSEQNAGGNTQQSISSISKKVITPKNYQWASFTRRLHANITAYGQATGSAGIALQFRKRMTSILKKTTGKITVLQCVDRIFERLVGMQVAAGFDGHMYEHSSAYQKAHSCETILINLVEGWRKARDNKLAVSILSTNMSKAFDSLHLPLLLSKLRAYGFHDSAVRLLNSYLCNRKYCLKLGSHVSSCRMVSQGCTQSALLYARYNGISSRMTYLTV